MVQGCWDREYRYGTYSVTGTGDQWNWSGLLGRRIFSSTGTGDFWNGSGLLEHVIHSMERLTLGKVGKLGNGTYSSTGTGEYRYCTESGRIVQERSRFFVHRRMKLISA